MKTLKWLASCLVGVALMLNASGVLNRVYFPMVEECGFHFGTTIAFALLIVPSVILAVRLIILTPWD